MIVTQTQKIDTEGTQYSSAGDERTEEGMKPQRKRISWPGRMTLFILFLLALGLSMAFPYGIGIVVFIWVVALIGAIFGTGLMLFNLVRELFGKTATFGYSPVTAYMTGKRVKKRRKDDAEKINETE